MRKFSPMLALAGILILATSTPIAMANGMDPAIWQLGKVDQAFTEAKKQNKPVLLYWGAVWCPPCNELKQQIFGQKRFRELAQGFLPVFIDGDSENAQSYSDRFQVKGYPTMVLFDAAGKELTRISGSLTMDEFGNLITAALTGGQSLEKLAQKAEQGSLSEIEWTQLAYASWDQLHKSGWSPAEKLATQKALTDQAPDRLVDKKAALVASLLGSAAAARDSKDSKVQKTVQQIRLSYPDYFAHLVRDANAMIAARSYFLYGAGDSLAWRFADRSTDPTYKKFKQQWLSAARTIRAQPKLSIDTKLWSLYPEIQFAKFESSSDDKDKIYPIDLKAQVQAAVRYADRQATTAFQRHAVISGAAYMLRLIGDYDGARQLLIKELRRTDTPWYYQSSLASLEKEAGRKPQALYWSGKASQSAKGRASKLQWIAADLLMTSSIDADGELPRIDALLRKFYGLALALPDGFSGRNETRANRVRDAMKPLLGKAKIRKTLQEYAKQCRTASAKADCASHFAALLGS